MPPQLSTSPQGSGPPSSSTDALAKRLLLGIAVFGLVVLVAGLLSNYVYASTSGSSWSRLLLGELREVLHPDRELTLWSWYSSLLLAGLALAFAGAAFAVHANGGRAAPYVVLALVSLAMSADEAAAFHEKLNVVAAALGVAVPWTHPWVFLGGVVVLLVGSALLWLGREIDARLRSRLLVGGAIFLAGALGTEILGGAVVATGERFTDPGIRLLYHVTLFFEEGMEALGAVIALSAVLQLLLRRAGSRQRNPRDQRPASSHPDTQP